MDHAIYQMLEKVRVDLDWIDHLELSDVLWQGEYWAFKFALSLRRVELLLTFVKLIAEARLRSLFRVGLVTLFFFVWI